MSSAKKKQLVEEILGEQEEPEADPIQAEHRRRLREGVPSPEETCISVRPSVVLAYEIDSRCFCRGSSIEDRLRNLEQRQAKLIECVGEMLNNLHPNVEVRFRLGEVSVQLEQKRSD